MKPVGRGRASFQQRSTTQDAPANVPTVAVSGSGKPISRPIDENGNFLYCILGDARMTIRTNHFEVMIDLSNEPEIYRYDVEVTNADRPRSRVSIADKRRIMDVAWRTAQQHFHVAPKCSGKKTTAYGYGYDGNNLMLTWLPLDITQFLDDGDFRQAADADFPSKRLFSLIKSFAKCCRSNGQWALVTA